MGCIWLMNVYMGMVKSDMLERFAFCNSPQLIANGRVVLVVLAWFALRKSNVNNTPNLQTDELGDEYFHYKRVHLRGSLPEYLKYDLIY